MKPSTGDVGTRRRRWLVGAIASLFVFGVGLGMDVLAGEAETRKMLGERYARAFSENARNHRVTWDDPVCAFVQRTPEPDRPDLHRTQELIIKVAQVTIEVTPSANARTGTLDVSFRCEPVGLGCIARTRRYGSTIIGGDLLKETTMVLLGVVADAPRMTRELRQLHAECVVADVDAGADANVDSGADPHAPIDAGTTARVYEFGNRTVHGE